MVAISGNGAQLSEVNMAERLVKLVKMTISHRVLYCGLALVYVASGPVGLDEETLKQCIAGLYILLAARG